MRYIEAYDPITLDWIRRLNTAGTSADAATRRATDAFVTKGKSDGWWTKQKRVNLFAGANLTAALIPLLVGGGNATDTNTNFVSGDYTKAGGLVGNGSSKYLDTGWVASNELASSFDAHHGAIVLTAGADVNKSHLGAASNGFARLFIAKWTPGSPHGSMFGYLGGGPAAPWVNASVPAGHLVTSVTASATGGAYQNGTLKQDASFLTSDLLTTTSTFVSAYNNNGGGVSDYDDAALGGYHLGTGLSATDIANMHSAIGTFCTAMGRTLP